MAVTRADRMPRATSLATRAGGHPTTAGVLSDAQFVEQRDRIAARIERVAQRHGLDFNERVLLQYTFFQQAAQLNARPQGVTRAELVELGRSFVAQVRS